LRQVVGDLGCARTSCSARHACREPPCGSSRSPTSPSTGRGSHGRRWLCAKSMNSTKRGCVKVGPFAWCSSWHTSGQHQWTPAVRGAKRSRHSNSSPWSACSMSTIWSGHKGSRSCFPVSRRSAFPPPCLRAKSYDLRSPKQICKKAHANPKNLTRSKTWLG
jgi:hypothetical protein